MKKFMINVNGKSFEVEVEEIKDGVAATPIAQAPAPVQAPAPTPVAAKAAPAPVAKPTTVAAAPAGGTKVSSPMPGTIVNILVAAGDSVKSGQVVCILEAMKMENEIAAPVDGTIATVNVSKGASVNTGEVLVTIG